MQKAFDLIVERLEERKQYYRKRAEIMKSNGQNHFCIVDNNRADAIKGAIEIVNQVAETYEQEVCEWNERLENHELTYKHCTYTNDTVAGVGYFKYCPYCGKKIKVVE